MEYHVIEECKFVCKNRIFNCGLGNVIFFVPGDISEYKLRVKLDGLDQLWQQVKDGALPGMSPPKSWRSFFESISFNILRLVFEKLIDGVLWFVDIQVKISI